MDLSNFFQMVKEANAKNSLNLLKPEKIEPIKPVSDLSKPPEAQKIPKLKTPKPLKLDTGLGESKPKFSNKMKTNSPYNER